MLFRLFSPPSRGPLVRQWLFGWGRWGLLVHIQKCRGAFSRRGFVDSFARFGGYFRDYSLLDGSGRRL